MKILPADDTGIQEAVQILKQGGIVAHATETCYGLACNVNDQKAVERLFELKQRNFDKPVSGLFENIESSKQYVEWNEAAEQYASDHLPGPYTVVLPLKSDALYPTPAGGQTIGIRISSHPIAQQLVKAFGKPITTTSANIADKPSAYSVQDIVDQGLKVDAVLDSGQLENNPSSTVIDFSDGSQTILR